MTNKHHVFVCVCLLASELMMVVQAKEAMSTDINSTLEATLEQLQFKRNLFSGQQQVSAKMFAKPFNVRLQPLSGRPDANTAKQQKQQQFTFKEKDGQGKVIASGKVITSQQLVAEGSEAIKDVFSGARLKELRLMKKSEEVMANKRMRQDNDDTCDKVCSFCKAVLSMRWAALCKNHCEHGGKAYDTCLTVWAFREELERSHL